MAKSSVQYVCSECGWNGPKWYGRCPECGQWGTVEEFHEARPAAGFSHGRSRPNITHAVGYGCQQRQICSPSDYRSGHGKRRAARYRVFRIRPCARRWRGAGFSNADSGRTGYRQVDIAVADGRQYRARCGGRQYVPRGRSAVCPTVGAGRRATHRTRCRCGATHHQHTPTPCCTFPARNHRRRFVCALPASMRWSRTCYWPPPPTCPQYWG